MSEQRLSRLQKLPAFKEPLTLNEAAFSINQLGKNMAEHAYLVGEILIWVKSKLKHGELMDWVEENVWFRRTTAQNFMAFTKKCIVAGYLLEEPHYLELPKLPNFGNVETPVLPPKKYNVIYADPPWPFRVSYFRQSAGKNYPVMSIEEICALPIQELTTERAILFLWTTNTFISEALAVCGAWGFEYKTNFAWCKNSGPSIGWFALGRHELLFIATKGENVHPKEKFPSWFEAKVEGKHSRKPEVAYSRIEAMYPGPYIELFAREKREKWDNWGSEVKHD